jgi:cell division septation protein DedD
MSLELAPHIERLLYNNDTVVIPGLGAFVSQPAPASVDYAGGSIAPPTKTLTFNENLITDDGLLTYELVQDKGMTEQDASAWVEEQVAEMLAQLNQREIVALPGIGRLYKNYVQKIQFLPDAANFSRDNFGLPPLQFSPLSRSREVTDTPSVNTTTTAPVINQVNYTSATPPVFSTSAPSGTNWSRIVLILGLLVLSGSLGYYFLNMQRTKLQTKNNPVTEPTEELSQTPTPPEEQSVIPSSPPAKEVEKATEPEKKAVPTPTPPVVTEKNKDKSCILLVGLFKDPTNIARLKSLLQKNGFEVYSTRTTSGAESIGVQFKYEEEAEIQSKIGKLQKLTGEQNIKVKRK